MGVGSEQKGITMLNRLFKYNRFSSMLFLLSFFVSFIIMYYGLDLSREFLQVGEVREDAIYTYGYRIMGIFDKDIVHAGDIGDGRIPGGNVIFRCEGPVGNGVINTDAIEVLWTQNEEMTESIKYEDYYAESAIISAPKCIIGDAWEADTYMIDKIRYIKVFGIESCVVGEYVSNVFKGADKRCLVFKDSLSEEELDKLLFDTGNACVIYKSNRSDEIDKLREWAQTFLKEDNFQEELLKTDVWTPINGLDFALFMSLYQKGYAGMLILCFINCAFLAYFWGETHIYEYMLKRTMGYGRLRLFADVILQFAVFEAVSLGAVLLVTCGYELLGGNLVNWYDNLRLGFMQAVTIFVLFGVVLSLFPMIPVMKEKPAQILKNIE